MRDIRFRAWADGVMHYESACEYLSGYGVLFQQFGKPEAVMQFTGLNDKNGKPIYEGDVCRAHHAKGTYVDGYIKYHNGRFCWTDDYCYWDLVFNRDGTPVDEVVGSLDDLEIIGNIWENPDLIENKVV